jgi:CheY-like chemotaxis protein
MRRRFVLDVLVSDVGMPGEDGWLAKRGQRDVGRRAAPMVAQSRNAPDGETGQVRSFGTVDVALQPSTKCSLQALLHAAFGLSVHACLQALIWALQSAGHAFA